ncbi:DUF305 domain-containing protein [Georgenia sp. H159]|uniref:DUF305 domain-containing protein n=1 Tax=Georgenia sp. H159 TaxID=3076115 RepID=UPI002D7908B9|nr:DUF305 domain-containing protein [Georgenia sp. H159]
MTAVTLAVSGLGASAAGAASECPSAGVCPAVEASARSGPGMQVGRWTTDVWFAVRMAEHHADAVEMAELAVARSARDELRDLAAEIARSQAEEIVLLRAAAERLGRPEDGPVMPQHGHHGGVDLGALSGEELDEAFLVAMVRHHRMGVHMAQVELARGSDPELRALAEVMVEVQTREIDTMRDWLRTWFDLPAVDVGPRGADPSSRPVPGGHRAGHPGAGVPPGPRHHDDAPEPGPREEALGPRHHDDVPGPGPREEAPGPRHHDDAPGPGAEGVRHDGARHGRG